ncbi:hypothetical protein RR46_11594 [Papilio xuthus]|uniref:Uncharacterized protein n=1 Tax=Papilio xuthus TaxID=66420 RepID=A0A194PR03_PAPXU|nr:hypothetical protein RR46_11594 [Papilio xuthus]
MHLNLTASIELVFQIQMLTYRFDSKRRGKARSRVATLSAAARLRLRHAPRHAHSIAANFTSLGKVGNSEG